MLILSEISFELISSTSVSDLYGLTQSILYPFVFGLYRKFTVPLVKTLCYHKWALKWSFICVNRSIIENEFYLRLLSHYLLIWQSWSALLLLLWILSELIYAWFCWRINFLFTVHLLGYLYHGQISVGPDYNILTYLLSSELRTLPP